jgi:hypothetical protein
LEGRRLLRPLLLFAVVIDLSPVVFISLVLISFLLHVPPTGLSMYCYISSHLYPTTTSCIPSYLLVLYSPDQVHVLFLRAFSVVYIYQREREGIAGKAKESF